MARLLATAILAGFLTTLLATGGAAAVAQGSEGSTTLNVEGMTCAGCEATVEAVLSGVDGVIRAEADRKTETALVRFDATRTQPDALIAAINSQTYYLASADGLSIEEADVTAGKSGELAGSAMDATAGTGIAAWLVAGVLGVGAGAAWLLRGGHRRNQR